MENKPIRFFLSYLRHDPQELKRFLGGLPPAANLLLPYRKRIPERYRYLGKKFENVEWIDMEEHEGKKSTFPDSGILESTLEDVFSDPSTSLIWERSKTSAWKALADLALGRRESFLKGSSEIADRIIFFLNFLINTKPSFLLFPSTPHTITSWIRMKAAQQLGVPTLVINRCAVDGFYRIAERRGREENDIQIGPLPADEAAIYNETLSRLVEKVNKSYADAQPEYERLRFQKNRGAYVRISQVWRKHWYAPGRAVNTFRCWRELKRSSHVLSHEGDDGYAIFFLHYQPERTTVPDGDLFGSQLNAILLLRAALPQNIKVLVKEHPSTFTNACHPVARDPEFYSRISSIQNVEFIDIQTDNFELVDSAILVATITGTVAREAVIRGTPVIFFGKSFISSGEWCFNYKKHAGFQAFIDRVAKGDLTRSSISKQAVSKIDSQKSNAFFAQPGCEGEKTLNALNRMFLSGAFPL